MKVTQKQLIKNNIFVTMVLVIGFILISTYISYSGIQNAKKSSELFSTLYLEENMSMVKNEVEERLGEIVQEREIIYQLELELLV